MPGGGAAAVPSRGGAKDSRTARCDESRMNERESMRPSRGGRGPPSPRTTLLGRRRKGSADGPRSEKLAETTRHRRPRGSRVAKVSKFRRDARRARHIRAHTDAQSPRSLSVPRPCLSCRPVALLTSVSISILSSLLLSPKMFHLLLPRGTYARLAGLAPLTDRTNATPRHSRQPSVTAEQPYRRGLNDRWRSLSTRLPVSLSEEKERFTGCDLRPALTLAKLPPARQYVYIRFPAHACALCGRMCGVNDEWSRARAYSLQSAALDWR